MALFAFDVGQDWSSIEFDLWLLTTAPLFLVCATVFGALAVARSRRKMRHDNKRNGFLPLVLLPTRASRPRTNEAPPSGELPGPPDEGDSATFRV
jgi:hypothetical protein